MTAVLGETADGCKTTQRTPKVRPETVIYDVDLTLTLPAKVSVTSGMNAIAHAVEALYAKDRNPVTSLLAKEGISVMARALPRIAADLSNRTARADALYAAFLCGSVLGGTTMALHHKLAHVLGGMFDLPHAELHATLLPHTVAYNAPATADAIERLARALGTPNASKGPLIWRAFSAPRWHYGTLACLQMASGTPSRKPWPIPIGTPGLSKRRDLRNCWSAPGAEPLST